MAEKKRVSKKNNSSKKRNSYPKEWNSAEVGKGYAKAPKSIENLYK